MPIAIAACRIAWRLRPITSRIFTWLPPTCGYRLVAEGVDLYWWHPLVSGDADTVHAAGISVRGKTVSEKGVAVDDFEEHVVAWPAELLARARRR